MDLSYNSGTIYIDCVDIIINDKHTGIQRVEYNILKNYKGIEKHFDMEMYPVFNLGNGKYVILDKVDIEDVVKKLGYFNFIRSQLGRFRQFKLFCKVILYNKNISCLIDALWKKKYRWFVIPALLFLTLPIVFLSLLIGNVSQGENIRTFSDQDIYVLLGAWWVGTLPRLDILHNAGTRIVILIHDLIIISNPEYFDHRHVRKFTERLSWVSKYSDLWIANSNFTKRRINEHLDEIGLRSKPNVKHFYLGYDLDKRENSNTIRPVLTDLVGLERPLFISVGTLEPRKNYGYLLDIYEILWEMGEDVNLLIVGRYGWGEADTKLRIERHKEYQNKLYWLDDVIDVELEFLYENAAGLVYPSFIEGFGLPLVEALSHGCPVLASDIPIFREIGGQYCKYFPLDDLQQASEVIASLIREDRESVSIVEGYSWVTWKESTYDFFSIINREVIVNSPRYSGGPLV